jgi:ribose transport system permease protein
VSIGPMIGIINAILVGVLAAKLGVTSPLALVPAALLIGVVLGAVNGALATWVRVQPIIATLGTYLILSGLTLTILPAPVGGAPDWLRALAGGWAVLPVGALILTWAAIVRTPFHAHLMATGSDARAAFSAGVPVAVVRFLSYGLGGLFAGLAALMETALIGSADPTIGPTLTLVAISAAALGGVGLAGGQGGLVAAMLGAADIFLLQATLTAFNVSPFVLQIAYGLILVASVCLNAALRRGRTA